MLIPNPMVRGSHVLRAADEQLAEGRVVTRRARHPGRPAHRFRRRIQPFADPLFEGSVSRRLPPRYLPRYGDTLRVYLSGAASDGASQADPDQSLGGFRAAEEASRVGVLFVTPLAGVEILQASRSNGAASLGVPAVGNLFADTDGSLAYAGPGGSAGDPVSLPALGAPVVLRDGSDPSKWLRVQRTAAGGLVGLGQLEFHDQLGNAFGMREAAEAESAAGGNRYRAVFLRPVERVTGIKLYLPTLGPAAVSTAAQLAGSGAGTVQGASFCFEGWPLQGWARIENAGVLREIVYYTSRTADALTVPAAGRGLLGSSAAAGAATDVIYPVPGCRIAYEAASPLAEGSVQTIASESTAPTGLTWSTARTAASGLAVGTLTAKQQVALWIHRELPAGAAATPWASLEILVEYVVDGVTYTERLAGLYRVADDDLERYELHAGVDAPPDLAAAPLETFASLPHTTTATFAAGHTHHLVVNRRNKYGLVSQNVQASTFTLDGGGVEIADPPSAPENIVWEASAGGTFRLRATYNAAVDASPADRFAIFARYNGTDPDPLLDVPTLVSFVDAQGVGVLDWTSPAQLAGTTGKVIVRMRRTTGPGSPQDSTNVDVHAAIAATAGPSTPGIQSFWRTLSEDAE